MQRTSVVFWASLALVLPFVLWGALSPDSLAAAAEAAAASSSTGSAGSTC